MSIKRQLKTSKNKNGQGFLGRELFIHKQIRKGLFNRINDGDRTHFKIMGRGIGGKRFE